MEGNVNNRKMTVTEAIAVQKYVLPLKVSFVAALASQLNNAKHTVEMANSQANSEIATMLDALSNKDSKNLDRSQIATITEAYQQNKFRKLVDPLDLVNKIDTLRKDNDTLAVGIDSFLSESNAIQHIQVDLD